MDYLNNKEALNTLQGFFDTGPREWKADPGWDLVVRLALSDIGMKMKAQKPSQRVRALREWMEKDRLRIHAEQEAFASLMARKMMNDLYYRYTKDDFGRD